MDENLLEIRDHEGEGYKALVDFAAWRVAILRFQDGLLPEQQSTMERHLETDEVFVLTKGEGTLIIGGNDDEVGQLRLQEMEIGKIYNVRQCAWHSLVLSRDGSVLIVENRDTGEHNSEHGCISEEQRRWIMEAMQRQRAAG